jgi:hypothetical protein
MIPALYLRSVSVLSIAFHRLMCHLLALHVVEFTLYCVFESSYGQNIPDLGNAGFMMKSLDER